MTEPVVLLALKRAIVPLGGGRNLSPIDLSLRAGEVVALLGLNGAGKTSLLRAAAAIRPLLSGSLEVLGKPFARGDDRQRLARALAYLPQSESSADTDLLVSELIELGRVPYLGPFTRPGAADRAAIDGAIAAADLSPFLSRRLDTLSAGERQRAHLARCFAQDTPLLLLDEPTASMDAVQARDLLVRVRARIENHARAALLVVHDLVLAARFADRILILGDGRLLASGPPSEVLTRATLKEALGLDAEITRTPDQVTLILR